MMWNFASNAIASLGLKKEAMKQSQAYLEVSDDEVCSNVSREEGLECPICCESFNIVENVPCVLWCGHTLCKNCVLGLQWAALKFPTQKIQIPFFISCPWCHFLSLRFNYKGNLKFPRKNYFLLSLVESLTSDRLKSLPLFSTDYNLDHSPNTNSIECQAISSNFRRGQYSPRGYMRSYSYTGGHTNSRFSEERHHHSSYESLELFIHFMAKLPLVFILLLIVFFVVPASASVLALYLLVTVFVALPSFLILYFTCPILGWLLREITA